MKISQQSDGRRGTVMVWLVVSLLALIGILALNIDGGRLMEERRRVQAAADAAALAAAKACADAAGANPGTLSTIALNAAVSGASSNGLTIDGVNGDVSVYIPPSSGDYKGQAGYVEVVVRSNLKGTFGRVFTQDDLVVRARAVARYKVIGILVLNPGAEAALNVSNKVSVSIDNASVFVDSANAVAMLTQANTSFAADAVNVVGGTQIMGSLVGPLTTNAESMPDPFISAPVVSVLSDAPQSGRKLTIGGGSVTLQPGVYVGGITIHGKANVTMAPGIYIMDGGGFRVSDQANVTGNEVMIYNTAATADAGQIRIGGEGSIKLTPPTSGPYAGMVLYQDPSLSLRISITGNLDDDSDVEGDENGDVAISGTIYNQRGPLLIRAKKGTTSLGSIIADTIRLRGNATVNIHAQTGISPQTAVITLVE